MQFKTVGERVQVLVYAGYDKEKRRAVVKMAGSISRSDYSLSDGLLESLTDSQKSELQSFIETLRQSDELKARQSIAFSIDSHIRIVADSIRSGEVDLTESGAAGLWAGLMKLEKTLKAAGFQRPAGKRPGNREPVVIAGQSDMLSV